MLGRASKRFSLTLIFCYLTALSLTHLDIFSRLALKRFEWYEVHSSFITTFISLLPLYVLALTLSYPFKRAASLVLERISYVIVATASLLVLFGCIQNELMQQKSYHYQSWIFFAVPFLLFLSICAIRSYSPHRADFFAKLVDHYMFVAAVFLLTVILVEFSGYNSRVVTARKPQRLAPTRDDSSQKPNVLLIALSSIRADSLLPEAQNLFDSPVVFNNSEAVSSWSLPSHASLLSGQYVHHHQASGHHHKLDEEVITLPEILSSNGYSTAGFVSDPFLKKRYGFDQGFDVYSDRVDRVEFVHTQDHFNVRRLLEIAWPTVWNVLLGSDGVKSAKKINLDAISWLESRVASTSPFFLFVNYGDTASVSNSSEGYEREYQAALHQVLSRVKELTDHLELLGMLDETVVIITASNGVELYEHGNWGSGNSLHRKALHVPLLFHLPKREASVTLSQQAGLIDVMPTLLDILNIPLQNKLDGKSLLPIINGFSSQGHTVLLSQLNIPARNVSQRALSTVKWRYIQDLTDENNSQLYDRELDVEEKANQHATESKVVQKFRWILKALLEKRS